MMAKKKKSMKKISTVILIGLTLLINAGCGRVVVVDRGDDLTGYWRGFIRYTNTSSKLDSFDPNPIPFYGKMEQTGNTVIGKYSHTFDADGFKNKLPERNYDFDGTISGDEVKLRMSNCSSTDTIFIPDTDAKLKHSNGRMTGTWVQYYKNKDGSIRTTYEGVIELIRY